MKLRSITLPPVDLTAITRLFEHRQIIYLIILFGVLFRTVDMWQPLNDTIRPSTSWREADVASIARNFYEEDMNILKPRIDWRGNGEGFVESEFPLYPWIVAVGYKLVGVHEELLRFFSWLTSIAALFVFALLARSLLPPLARTIAIVFYSLSPLSIKLATAIQPEPFVHFLSLLAIYTFWRWIQTDGPGWFLIALAGTTLALLSKITAIHIGILFFFLALNKYKSRILFKPRLWIFVIISLGVPFAWYLHAHQLWLEHHNSLGISNEGYVRIFSFDFIKSLGMTLPYIIWIELRWVWLSGILIALAALPLNRHKPQPQFLLAWITSLVIFFIITGRTTGENWAYYYHIFSVPLAALLFGLGYQRLTYASNNIYNIKPVYAKILAPALLCITIGLQVITVTVNSHPHDFKHQYHDSIRFAEHIPENTLIAVSGPSRTDQHGLLRAANPSYFFYWLHQKGFTFYNEPNIDDAIQKLRDAGVKMLIVEKYALEDGSFAEENLKDKLPIIREGETAILFSMERK
jgi:4-amino-4-deoxy-L-arabinose transferase-like glycosyltransferase